MQKAGVTRSKPSAVTGVGGEIIQDQEADLKRISEISKQVRSMSTTEMQRTAKNSSAHEMHGLVLL